MYEADITNHHVGSYISATMLTGAGCRRQVFYERTVDYYEVPLRRFWPFRGTLAHRAIEGAGEALIPYGWAQEVRLSTELTYDLPAPIFDGDRFTGRFDESKSLVVPLGGTTDAVNPYRKLLVDMKSMAENKVYKFVTGNTKGTYSAHHADSHVEQLNIYRWMLARTPIPQALREKWIAAGLPPIKSRCFPAPTTLTIQAFSMMDMPHSAMQYSLKDGYTKTTFEIDAVPVLPLAAIEEMIRPRALLWYKALVLGIIPPVVEKEGDWMCRSCPFNGEKIPGERCFPTKERKNI
jgi:hypothetical protein